MFLAKSFVNVMAQALLLAHPNWQGSVIGHRN
ncbi:MAG: hypothetical protein ACJAYR_002744 [Sneathiella sp.]|jgi:hypothetical protein